MASSKEYGKNCSPTKAQAFVKDEQKNSLLQMPTDSKEQQENISLSKRSADSKDQQKNLSRKRSVESNKQLEHPLLSKKVAYSKDQQNNLLNGPVPDKSSISTSNAQLGHPLLSKRHSNDGPKNVSQESGTNNLSTSSAKQPPLEHTLLSKRNSKEEQHNLSVESDADEPSTSSFKSKQKSGQSPRTTRSSPRSSKRPRRTSVNQEIGDQLDYTPTKSPCLVESSNANISNTIDEDYEMANCESFATQSVPNAKEVDNSKNSMSLSSIGTGIVNKIKDFCKLPFRTSKSHENKVITRNTTTFKPPKKTENVPKIASAAIKLGLNELKEEQTKIAKNDLNRSAGILYSTPTNSISTAYQRGSGK